MSGASRAKLLAWFAFPVDGNTMVEVAARYFTTNAWIGVIECNGTEGLGIADDPSAVRMPIQAHEVFRMLMDKGAVDFDKDVIGAFA